MKIAHVVDSMEIGGAEVLVSQMCRLLRKQGHEPSVYAVASMGPIGEQMQADGFSVKANIGHHLSDSMRNFYSIFHDSRPDVVHLHNPTPTMYAGVSARVAGVPCIVSTRHSLVAPPRRLIVEMKYAVAATFCDWVVGICDATINHLNSIHGFLAARKIVRVYNGTTPLKRVARASWPPKIGFTLVFVGRLEPVKNHAFLLNAFCSALQLMPGLQLWMVGDGSERKMLESLAKALRIDANVTFWGQQHDVSPFLSAADAFIMSSRSEGLPISLLQAFSLGLPAIVTDVGGMAEVVRLAQAGLIVSATAPAEMAAAIMRLSASEVERKQFSRNAEEAYISRFTLETMVDAYMKLYRNTARDR